MTQCVHTTIKISQRSEAIHERSNIRHHKLASINVSRKGRDVNFVWVIAISLLPTPGTVLRHGRRAPACRAPLNNGPLNKGTVTCMWHGWRFPVQWRLRESPQAPAVPTFPVTVRGYDVHVTLPSNGAGSSRSTDEGLVVS